MTGAFVLEKTERRIASALFYSCMKEASASGGVRFSQRRRRYVSASLFCLPGSEESLAFQPGRNQSKGSKGGIFLCYCWKRVRLKKALATE
jgi:hypothetical protein